MRPADLDTYRCPACHGRLELANAAANASHGIETGQLRCDGCKASYPILKGIPRFVPPRNYADSFGLQWNRFPTTQLDQHWQRMYRERFFQTTNFSARLDGQLVLEVGCGPGNFTGIILATGARLFSSDLSNAVDACHDNWARDSVGLKQLSLSQADLEALPYAPGSFDKVICLGVIQHCPDPKRAFQRLCQYVKPGGEIVIDCYEKVPWSSASCQHITKHLLRSFTKHLPQKVLYRLVNYTITFLYDLKAMIGRVPLVGDAFHRIIPIGELQREDWTPQQMKEIKALNVFDMLAPRYDNPQSIDTVKGWIAQEQFILVKCDIGHNGVNAKAVRPLS